MQNWIDEIKTEDLPENYQQMAALIGIDATLKLAEFYSKQLVNGGKNVREI